MVYPSQINIKYGNPNIFIINVCIFVIKCKYLAYIIYFFLFLHISIVFV